jgi:signal peptidase II
MQPIADRGQRRSSPQAAGGAATGSSPERTTQAQPRSLRPWLLAAAVAVGVVAIDQIAKHAVEGSIAPGEEHRLLPGIQLVNTRNHGVAFGFLPGSHFGVTILIGLALLILLVYFARHASRRLIWLPTGMLMGGALGNIIDRLRAGSVTDFIKLPLGWPPFNLADASITLGILILFMVIESSRRTQP